MFGVLAMALLLWQTNRRIDRQNDVQSAFTEEVRRMVNELQRLTPIQVREMSTTYIANVNGSPQSHTVTDTQNVGESDADFTARHFRHVASDQANGYPIWH